jgi:tetratricopeptide (TPR) repeat protein
MHARIASIVSALCLLVLVCACEGSSTDHLAVDAPRAQHFDGLGSHARAISTTSSEAQDFFDQGLAWMYSFNHDEAIRSFARAAELDPEAAMPWWGISLCEGPNYNDPIMTEERSRAAWGALKQALARIENTSPVERALIEALAERYAKPWPEDRSDLDESYSDAMAELWSDYPDDSDVGTLYAESLMVRRPWKLYTIDEEPEEDTPTIVSTLERVMEMDPGNPGSYHLYIHAVEPSKTPERGLPAAERLEAMVPGAGHMRHMPSHIYVQTGRWSRSISQNKLAMTSDDRYRELSPDQGVQHMYMVHNAHMLAFSAMMVGREKEAMAAARDMWTDIPEPVLEAVAPYLDLWMCSVYDVQKRFGRWEAILEEPAPPEYLPMTTAVWRAHRAVAHAALKNIPAAEEEHRAFREVLAGIPEESIFGQDSVHRILEVSDLFVEGEIEAQKENWASAAEILERAVEVEDDLWYGEPPAWLQPTRHTLGAVYLEAGEPAEAERVYRDDLEKWPGNGWSLLGLKNALEAQGRDDEASAVALQFDEAWADADAPTSTSCLCLPGA